MLDQAAGKKLWKKEIFGSRKGIFNTNFALETFVSEVRSTVADSWEVRTPLAYSL
jgi:hypothetical protein